MKMFDDLIIENLNRTKGGCMHTSGISFTCFSSFHRCVAGVMVICAESDAFESSSDSGRFHFVHFVLMAF